MPNEKNVVINCDAESIEVTIKINKPSAQLLEPERPSRFSEILGHLMPIFEPVLSSILFRDEKEAEPLEPEPGEENPSTKIDLILTGKLIKGKTDVTKRVKTDLNNPVQLIYQYATEQLNFKIDSDNIILIIDGNTFSLGHLYEGTLLDKLIELGYKEKTFTNIEIKLS